MSGAEETDEMQAVFSDGTTWKIPGYTHKQHRENKAKGKKPNANFWEGKLDGKRIFLNTYTRQQGAKVFIGCWRGGGGMISQLTLRDGWDLEDCKEMMKTLAVKYSKNELSKEGLEAAKASWIGELAKGKGGNPRKRPAGAPKTKAEPKKVLPPEETEGENETEENDEEEGDEGEQEDEEEEAEEAEHTQEKNKGILRRPAAASSGGKGPAGTGTPPTTPTPKRPRTTPPSGPFMKRPSSQEVSKGLEVIPKQLKNNELVAGEPPVAASPSGSAPSRSPLLKDISIPEDSLGW